MDLDVDLCSTLYEPWIPEEFRSRREHGSTKMILTSGWRPEPILRMLKGQITPSSKEDISRHLQLWKEMTIS